MKRTQMTSKERGSRSKLKPYINWGEFIRGTLTIRKQICGKANCKCTKGEKHKVPVLTRSKNGKYEQLYISPDKVKVVKEWIKRYQEMQQLLEKVSDSYWDRLKKKD